MCERAETERLESPFFLAVEDLLFIETNLLKQPMRQVVVVLRSVGGGELFCKLLVGRDFVEQSIEKLERALVDAAMHGVILAVHRNAEKDCVEAVAFGNIA